MRLCDCGGITVLSLFDGISCARVALDRAGVLDGCTNTLNTVNNQ